MYEEKTVSGNRDDSAEAAAVQIRFSDIWRGVVKFWWLCLLLAVIGAGIMFYKSYIRFTPVYQCEATFTVSTKAYLDTTGGTSSTATYYNRVNADMLSTTFPSILQSSILQEIICAELETSYMPGTISASALTGTNLFTLTAKASDAQMAYDLLMAVMDNYPKVAEYIIGNTVLNMLSEPQVPSEPINRYTYRSQVAKGALAGLVLGAVWILLYAYSRDTIRTKKDVQRQLRQSCIGVIPYVTFKKHKRKINTSIMWDNPFIGDGFLESMRSCRNTLLHQMNESEKLIMVTSTAPGEGKTTITVNLAASIAAMGKKVLLIDADLRNSSVLNCLEANAVKAEPKTDAAFYIPKHAQIYDVEQYKFSVIAFQEEKNLWSTLNHGWFQKWMNQFRNHFDYVIIDTPPCGLLTDVVNQEIVRTGRIQQAIENIQGKHARLIGCILNGAASGVGGYGANYGYARYYSRYSRYGNHYYGYGQKESGQQPETETEI